jgi:hypothetical protein
MMFEKTDVPVAFASARKRPNASTSGSMLFAIAPKLLKAYGKSCTTLPKFITVFCAPCTVWFIFWNGSRIFCSVFIFDCVTLIALLNFAISCNEVAVCNAFRRSLSSCSNAAMDVMLPCVSTFIGCLLMSPTIFFISFSGPVTLLVLGVLYGYGYVYRNAFQRVNLTLYLVDVGLYAF